MNTYFFPINSSSLAHYFGCACIKAAKYFDNKPQDIQDRFKDFLLLTNKKGTVETDCCLELVFTEEETKYLIDVKNGWFLFGVKPIPITRIKKIYFSNKEQKNVTITNITMSTAFIPDALVGVCKFDENKTNLIQVPTDCQSVDLTNKINQYDRFLGALALMRLAHEPYMNYSPNYISTLSFFNKTIENQLKANEKIQYNNAFQGIFNAKGFEKVMPFLGHPIDEEALNKIAKEEKQEIRKDKISKIIDIESINDKTWTYIIAILNTYGVGDESRKKRVDGLIQSNFSSIKDGKQEGVALCYGYNRGYSVFNKSYGNVACKYKFESKLDYYTVESVYQYVFNDIISSEFAYLDNWCPKLQAKLPKRKTDYIILDELVIGKKKAKVFSPEWWNGFSQKFNKSFDSSKPIILIIKNIIEPDIYSDIQDELQEDYENIQKNKQVDISLKEELNRVKKMLLQTEEENRQLQEELKKANDKSHYNSYNESIKSTSVIAEPSPNYGTPKSKEEYLKSVVIKYQDCTLGELKSMIKKPKPTDSIKLGDLLQKLTNNNDLFS